MFVNTLSVLSDANDFGKEYWGLMILVALLWWLLSRLVSGIWTVVQISRKRRDDALRRFASGVKYQPLTTGSSVKRDLERFGNTPPPVTMPKASSQAGLASFQGRHDLGSAGWAQKLNTIEGQNFNRNNVTRLKSHSEGGDN